MLAGVCHEEIYKIKEKHLKISDISWNLELFLMSSRSEPTNLRKYPNNRLIYGLYQNYALKPIIPNRKEVSTFYPIKTCDLLSFPRRFFPKKLSII